jgi:hypothetical protein
MFSSLPHLPFEALRNRPDIWISANLCDHALALLDRQPI